MLLLLCAAILPAPAAHAATDIGAAEEVVRNVYGTSITRRMKPGEALIADQKVSTQLQSAATLKLLDDSRLALGPQSEVVLDEFVYQPAKNLAAGAINVAKGLMRFTSARARLDVTVRTPAATIGIRGTIFDVMVSRAGTEVAVREGAVQVDTGSGSHRVSAGQAITVPDDGGPPRLGKASAAMEKAVAEMAALLPRSAAPRHATGAGTATVRAASTGPAGGRAMLPPEVLRGKDAETLLLLNLVGGTVAIQLRPDLAPRHAAWLKELVRQGYFDGIGFHSVVEGFAAETGDPSGTGSGGATRPMDPEFSPISFQRGSVGMKPKQGDASTATSQFFIVLRAAPHLDGKYTYIGDVVYGLEHIGRLAPGQPPPSPSQIVSMQIAADAARAH